MKVKMSALHSSAQFNLQPQKYWSRNMIEEGIERPRGEKRSELRKISCPAQGLTSRPLSELAALNVLECAVT
jgi:hypothetical protein